MAVCFRVFDLNWFRLWAITLLMTEFRCRVFNSVLFISNFNFMISVFKCLLNQAGYSSATGRVYAVGLLHFVS